MDTLPPTAGASLIWGESESYEGCFQYGLTNAQPELIYVSVQVTPFVSCPINVITSHYSPTPIIPSSLSPVFDCLLEEVEDYSNASSSTPVILSSLKTLSNSSLKEVEDCSNTSFSTPVALSSLSAESNSLLEEVEDCSNTSSSPPIVLSPSQAESNSSSEEVVAGTIEDRRRIPCADRTCSKKYTRKYNMYSHLKKHNPELYKTMKQSAKEKPIPCDGNECRRRYTRKDKMRAHARKHHPGLYEVAEAMRVE